MLAALCYRRHSGEQQLLPCVPSEHSICRLLWTCSCSSCCPTGGTLPPARRPSDAREHVSPVPSCGRVGDAILVYQCRLPKREPQPQVVTPTCILKLKHLWGPMGAMCRESQPQLAAKKPVTMQSHCYQELPLPRPFLIGPECQPRASSAPVQGQLSAAAQAMSIYCLVSDSNINRERGHWQGDSRDSYTHPQGHPESKGKQRLSPPLRHRYSVLDPRLELVIFQALWVFGQCRGGCPQNQQGRAWRECVTSAEASRGERDGKDSEIPEITQLATKSLSLC